MERNTVCAMGKEGGLVVSKKTPCWKLRFRDHEEAVSFIQKRNNGQFVYECPNCRGWHLTHVDQTITGQSIYGAVARAERPNVCRTFLMMDD